MEMTKGTIDLMKAAKVIADTLAESVWKKDLMQTHALYASIDHHLVGETIHILYNHYGMMQDMGVGRHVPIDMVGYKGQRKPVKWYSKTMYRQVARLAEYVAEQLGVDAQRIIGTVGEGGRVPIIDLSMD